MTRREGGGERVRLEAGSPQLLERHRRALDPVIPGAGGRGLAGSAEQDSGDYGGYCEQADTDGADRSSRVEGSMRPVRIKNSTRSLRGPWLNR